MEFGFLREGVSELTVPVDPSNLQGSSIHAFLEAQGFNVDAFLGSLQGENSLVQPIIQVLAIANQDSCNL